jgi:hypothetical protein
MLRYAVSKAEAALIGEIEQICYGEILDLLAVRDPLDRNFSGTQRQLNFLKALRQEGKLDRVIIHDGEPAAAEIQGLTRGGFRFIRKLKF